jgi:arylsulfatase A-like enzyme/Tfp pilus assembly protein PilF
LPPRPRKPADRRDAPSPPPVRPEARRRRIALALGLAAILALAVVLARTRSGTGAGSLPRASGADVVLVTIDTLRADAVGAYGRADAGTPWIDRLAHDGVRFETVRAHNVMTLPSHATILSGLLPLAHGIRDNSGFRFPEDLPTLATALKARGYRTGAFVSAFVLDSRFGLDRGFDVYDDRVGGAADRGGLVIPERPGPETVAAAVRWLDSAQGAPSFLFLHLFGPHSPYAPPEPFASRFRGEPYQGEVAAADAALEPLLRPLLGGGRRRPSLVVLTADHGEGLGEHGEESHGVFGYEATLRVPLVLCAPGFLSPRVVKEPVRLVDVMPTVLDLVGIEPPGPLDGRSLLPLAAGRAASPADTYFEALSSSLDRGWAPLHGIVVDSLKYVDLPIPELYDLGRDPGERTNLAAQRPDDLERLRSRLVRIRGTDRLGPRVAEDSATLGRLRALGYVSGGGAPVKAHYGPEDDPKRLIGLVRREDEILHRFREGDYDGARELCRRSLAERPDMAYTWTQLASIERARGALADAAEAGQRAVALRPGDPATVALFGGLLVEAGRPEAARRILAPLLRAAEPDPDILISEGMALASLGRRNEALAVFERVHRLDPGNALALVDAGTVHLMGGDLARARQAFSAAIAADPAAARAHNGLGVVAAREGRPEEAISYWKRAVELDPRDYQTLFNLGSTLRARGRPAEARPYLEAYLQTAPATLERRDRAKVRAWLDEPR